MCGGVLKGDCVATLAIFGSRKCSGKKCLSGADDNFCRLMLFGVWLFAFSLVEGVGRSRIRLKRPPHKNRKNRGRQATPLAPSSDSSVVSLRSCHVFWPGSFRALSGGMCLGVVVGGETTITHLKKYQAKNVVLANEAGHHEKF